MLSNFWSDISPHFRPSDAVELQAVCNREEKSDKKNGVLSDTRKTFSLKSTSSCLLAVACFLVLFISSLVYIGLRLNSNKKELTLDDAHHRGIYAKTIGSMNGTFQLLDISLEKQDFTPRKNEIY